MYESSVELSKDFFKRLKVWNIPCHELSKIVDKCNVTVGSYGREPDIKFLVCKDFFNHVPNHVLFFEDKCDGYIEKIRKVSSFLKKFRNGEIVFVPEDFNWCMDMAEITFQKSIYFDKVMNLILRYRRRPLLSNKKNLRAVSLIFSFFIKEQKIIDQFESGKLNKFGLECDVNFELQDLKDELKSVNKA